MDAKTGSGVTGADIRAKLGHPVVDGDSHMLEFTPVVFDFLKQVAGLEMCERLKSVLAVKRLHQDVFWSRPSGVQSIDTLTAMLPDLYRGRIDDLGFDFAVLYPSMGLIAPTMRDDDLRRALCRAFNVMNMELFGTHADRFTPAAVIPTYTPEEAIRELDYSVGELGYKSIMIWSEIRRPDPEVLAAAPGLAHLAENIHSLAVDAEHDFDPFWQRCVDHRVAPTCHTKIMGGGTTRRSPSNFVFNHLGAFASGSDFLARSLFMGGVTRRFPGLNFGYLEGGVAWGSNLYNDIVEHWGKRNLPYLLENQDPGKLDQELALEMFEKYDNKYLDAGRLKGGDNPFMPRDKDVKLEDIDDFSACGIEKKEDIKDLFCESFYFGCEADDVLVPIAFDTKLNHFGAKLKVTFSSDIGHWDVPDMLKVLPEAYEFVEDGKLDVDQFREFTFENQVQLLGGMNPYYFVGTAVEAEAAKLLAG